MLVLEVGGVILAAHGGDADAAAAMPAAEAAAAAAAPVALSVLVPAVAAGKTSQS